jgi:hypothetical protein
MLRVRRIIMVAALLVALLSSAAAFARHELEQSLLERTAALFELAPDAMPGAPRALFLNGARIVIATASTPQPVSVMLDHLQAGCRRQSGGFHEAAKRLSARPDVELPSLLDGVLRVESGEQGLVGCLALGEAHLDVEQWLARVRAFAERGDLQALGGLRVARVRAQGSGSFVVLAWNEGPVPLVDMFPADKDAPGVDFTGVPRPVGARRVLSAWQEHAETAINVYTLAQPAAQAFADYTEILARHGWHAPAPAQLSSRGGPLAALLERGGRTLVLHAYQQGADSLLTVLPMNAGPGAVSVRP